MMGLGMGVGIIWMVLFWGGLIFLAIWLVSVLFPASPPMPPDHTNQTSPSARKILDQRYASGEISREQYDEMRHTIEQ